ncbi:hypothetical protein LEQ06_06895 [Paraclostridium sp. AKS46]|uniref:Uncharacterized protein n=1 Tax=Paraclostridium bifermentans TaxID=1490 RepID=A0A5P3XJ88_PARBF|nr:hypothetical protein [Paraclostridium bifermentans]MCU9807916.1 hypothetical protein [Paraclostridium sp. AKS46]QEZ70414.1 hypothetical protein D4A35_16475 [Paraclostridium bifermentans]
MKMSLVKFLSCLYFIFTVLLLIKRNTMGKIYVIFGMLTYVFVILYSSIPNIPLKFQQFTIFIAFSLMIIIFGLMFGFAMKMFNKSNNVAAIMAILSSFLMIIIVFNVNGYLTYMYIPVLLYMLKNKLNTNG